MRLSSSRSFNPSQKFTRRVPFFEINSTVFFCNIALDTIYRGLKVKRNCVYIGSHFKRFWLHVAKSAPANWWAAKQKKRLMRLSKVSCIWRLNIGRLAGAGRKRSWVIFTHKSKQDVVPSTSPMEYYGTWHIRMIIWTFWPCQIVDGPEMTSDTRHCCMCLPLPHQDSDSYHSGEESFANIWFG